MIIVFPDGSVVWITPDDVEFVIRHAFRRKTPFLDYRTTTAEKYYGKGDLKWVQIETRTGLLRAPYELVADYRLWPEELSWGEIELIGDYSFPTELSEHRDAMIRLFTKKKLLRLGNNPCPRISRIDKLDSGVPKYYLEKAWYFDQVGTNLTLDYPLDSPVLVAGVKQFTVRDWDIAQCGGTQGYLSAFEFSRLANTVGVAVGITAETKDRQTVIVARKRSKRVAVYPNMWHLPFSFALSLVPYEGKYHHGDLKNFISFDVGHEQAAELGLEPADLGALMPVAFCRDLVRGGKPQFFFEQRAKVTFEELREKIRESTVEKEYTGRPVAINASNQPRGAFSPELLCFLLLKS